MALTKKRLAAEAVKAANEFLARRLFDRVGDREVVALNLPGQELPVLASITGQSGISTGLVLFTGADAAGRLLNLFEDRSSSGEGLIATDKLTLGFVRFAEVPAPWRSLLELAGVSARRDRQVPLFAAHPRGRQPKVPVRDELEIFVFAMNALLAADERGELFPVGLTRGGDVLALDVEGDPRSPSIRSRFETFSGQDVAPAFSAVALPSGVAELPHREVTWWVALPLLPVPISGEDRIPRLFLVSGDEGEGELPILLARVVHFDEIEGVTEEFFGLLFGKGKAEAGLPRRLIFSSQALFDLLGPALAAVDVKTEYEPQAMWADEIVERFLESRLKGAGMPDRSDLAGWKESDRRLTNRLDGMLEHLKGATNARNPLQLYFGARVDGEALFRKFAFMAIEGAFQDWLLMCYREDPVGPTLAERLLAEGLPPDLKRLLEARMNAPASFYEAASVDKETGRFELRDLLSGEREEAWNFSLSQTLRPGSCLTLRLYGAGSFKFMSIAGPIMNRIRAEKAIGWLREGGVDLTPEGLRRDPHVFRKLWPYVDRMPLDALFQPAVRNMEGHELRFCTATFVVEDEAALRGALEKREDVEETGDDEYRWFVMTGRPGMGRTSLGRIQVLPGELVLETNSVERFERAREWLEGVPGVTFGGVEEKDFVTASEEATPLDDRLNRPEIEATPELREEIERMMREHYLAWLDEPIPALSGKTPREACRSEPGRRRVRELIEEIPPPTSQPGLEVEIPKEEMLRRLGLEE